MYHMTLILLSLMTVCTVKRFSMFFHLHVDTTSVLRVNSLFWKHFYTEPWTCFPNVSVVLKYRLYWRLFRPSGDRRICFLKVYFSQHSLATSSNLLRLITLYSSLSLLFCEGIKCPQNGCESLFFRLTYSAP